MLFWYPDHVGNTHQFFTPQIFRAFRSRPEVEHRGWLIADGSLLVAVMVLSLSGEGSMEVVSMPRMLRTWQSYVENGQHNI